MLFSPFGLSVYSAQLQHLTRKSSVFQSAAHCGFYPCLGPLSAENESPFADLVIAGWCLWDGSQCLLTLVKVIFSYLQRNSSPKCFNSFWRETAQRKEIIVAVIPTILLVSSTIIIIWNIQQKGGRGSGLEVNHRGH